VIAVGMRNENPSILRDLPKLDRVHHDSNA
jgi:hypothetical protein